MRSRYSAYVLEHVDYLLATWHARTRPERADLATPSRQRWLGLTVRESQLIEPDRATVEFIARYRIDGRAFRMHELSRFEREQERWYYVDGDRIEA